MSPNKYNIICSNKMRMLICDKTDDCWLVDLVSIDVEYTTSMRDALIFIGLGIGTISNSPELNDKVQLVAKLKV